MTYLSQSSRLNHPDYISWTVQTMKFLIVEPSPLPIPIPLALLGPNIRRRILFSNTFSLYSSLNVGDHVLQRYSTNGNIIVLYILIFKFLECSREDKSVLLNNNMNFELLVYILCHPE
jgi:hypothetical protein